MRERNFFVAAALVSCLAAVVVFLIRLVGLSLRPSPQVIASITVVVAALGLAAAAVALIGVRSHGREGILVPAVIGLLLGILFLVTSINVLVHP